MALQLDIAARAEGSPRRYADWPSHDREGSA